MLAVREKVQHLAYGPLLADRVGQWKVVLDVVSIAATVSLLYDVARCGQVHDDPVGGPLGDIKGGGKIAQTGVRVVGDKQHRPSVVGEEAPVAHAMIVDRF